MIHPYTVRQGLASPMLAIGSLPKGKVLSPWPQHHCRPSFLPAVRASDSKNQLKTPEDSLSDCRQAVQAAEDAVSAADEKSSWEEKFSAIFTVKNFGFFMLYALNVTSYTLKYEGNWGGVAGLVAFLLALTAVRYSTIDSNKTIENSMERFARDTGRVKYDLEDQIRTVNTNLTERFDGLDKKVDALNEKFGGLEVRVGRLKETVRGMNERISEDCTRILQELELLKKTQQRKLF